MLVGCVQIANPNSFTPITSIILLGLGVVLKLCLWVQFLQVLVKLISLMAVGVGNAHIGLSLPAVRKQGRALFSQLTTNVQFSPRSVFHSICTLRSNIQQSGVRFGPSDLRSDSRELDLGPQI